MARFKYRLQKVFELRERKKKEQEEAVIRAKAKVREAEENIEAKKNEIRLLKQNLSTAPHTLMESYVNYIRVCFLELDDLYVRLQVAKDDLAWEMELLLKAQADLEALIKHKEKSLEEWKEEEKRLEMKVLDEVAGQRYFRAQQEKLAEEMQELALSEAEGLTEVEDY